MSNWPGEARSGRYRRGMDRKSLFCVFLGCCCAPVLLRKPLENCLRAVRHGPHFVQSTKPQFSEVPAFLESGRYTATEKKRTTCEKARFPACGKCRPRRMAGKRFFRRSDSIRTPGLMPLPFPRFFEKNRVKLLILRTFIRNINASAVSRHGWDSRRHAVSAMATPIAARHRGCASQPSPGRNTAPAYNAPPAAHRASLPLRRGIPASRAVVRSNR